jgi:chromosome partitioning protein
MRTIAITNQKGGTAKTTTAVNLSAALGERGRRVLVLDLDPQANATSWFGVTDGGRGLLEVFTENRNLDDLVQDTGVPGISIVPSSSWLTGIEKDLSRQVGAEFVLRRQLERLKDRRWDFLFLDCPPALGILTVNALVAAKEILVPVTAHVLSLNGLASLLETVRLAKERLNSDLEIFGILACRVDLRTRHAVEVVEELREHFGRQVFRTVIRENVRLAEAPSFKKPITQYDDRSHGAEDYRRLALEVIKSERKRR